MIKEVVSTVWECGLCCTQGCYTWEENKPLGWKHVDIPHFPYVNLRHLCPLCDLLVTQGLARLGDNPHEHVIADMLDQIEEQQLANQKEDHDVE